MKARITDRTRFIPIFEIRAQEKNNLVSIRDQLLNEEKLHALKIYKKDGTAISTSIWAPKGAQM